MKVVVPVSNLTNHDTVVRAKTQVGIVVSVNSVIPCPIQVNSVSAKEEQEGSVTSSESESDDELMRMEARRRRLRRKIGCSD